MDGEKCTMDAETFTECMIEGCEVTLIFNPNSSDKDQSLLSHIKAILLASYTSDVLQT